MLAFRRPARLLRRPRRPAALISAAGLLAAALLGSVTPPAGAAAPAVAFHGYSVFEIHLSGVVSSLSVTRPDEAAAHRGLDRLQGEVPRHARLPDRVDRR